MQCGTCGLTHLPLILQHTFRLAACCFRDTLAVYSDDNLKCINAVCGHNLDMYMLKQGNKE